MADPLCRWHYALPKNVVEIVRALPKQEMPKAQFLQHLKTTLSAGEFSFDFATFQKTAYQLAVQLGLYYIDDSDVYHPRFGVDIDEATAARYLAVVAQCYVAPNPYTNAQSFGVGQMPVNLYSALIGHSATLPRKSSFDVSEALKGCFAAPLGNPDAVTALMSATSVFTKVGNKSLLYDPKFNRTLNRKEFFDLFSWPYISSGDAKIEVREDVLAIALECFRANRNAVKASAGWNTFDEWAKAARVAFDGVDETKATDPNFDYAKFMRQFAISETVANTQFLGHTNDEKAAVLKFLHEQQTNPQIVTWYLDGTHRPQANGEDVKGMGATATLYFMMELHPNLYASWSDMTYDSLSKVGLHNGPAPAKLTLQSYDDCKAKQCMVLAKMKKMGIGKTADDPFDADYITVNEFLWFVKEHFKEINEEVTKMSVTPVQHQAYDKTKTKKKTFNADSKEDQLMLRILASLRTKPFVILAGHSGTGKSRMVKKLAYLTCRDNKLHEGSDPGNYCIIEVKPNWHDSTELLGYFSSFGHDHYVTKQLVEFIMRAYAYPDVPFFVCLDEMNLAPVEQYFAEFLSALEDIHVDEGKMNEFFGLNAANKPEGSAAQEVVKYTSAPLIKPIDYKDDIALLEPKTTQAMDWLKTHGLTIPKNLFVVGTVNMDESTNQFSRKVLDRAFTIEMSDARFEDFGDEGKDPMPTFAKEDEIDHALIDNLLMGKKQAGKLSTRGTDANQPKGQLENMNDLKGILAGTPFVVAYRFANEYALYEDALNVLDVLADGASEADKVAKKAANAKRAFDDVVLMKLLPRIAGERAVVTEIFEGRAAKDDRPAKRGLRDILPYKRDDVTEETVSGRKMKEIMDRGNVPYLTFWP